jgi:naringenin degradation protein FdeD
VKYTLCTATDIADPGSKAFSIMHNNQQTLDVFVVHSDGRFHAYVNSCPHTGVNLEWLEDQFLDLDHAFIQCSNHDALFEIDSGLCVAGPCVDKLLQALELTLINAELVLDVPDDFINLHHAT